MINSEMLWTGGSTAQRPANGTVGLGWTDAHESGKDAGLAATAATTMGKVSTSMVQAPTEKITVYLLDDHEIVRLGLSGSVTMLGRVSDEDLVSWYQRADLVITPTQELEGFGLATAALSWRLLDLTWDQPSAILELPMAWVYAAWPVSGLLCAGDVLVTWITGRRQEYRPVDIT